MRINFLNLDSISATSWENARGMLRDELERLKSTINTTWDVSHHVDGTQRAASRGELLGQLTGTLAEQPTGLSVANDGLIFFVSDYGHLVRWNGSLGVWAFAPGDNGSGYFADFAITPQATGWALCDGSSVTYLVVGGAALATASITLPNLTGTPAYRKSAAAYTGTIVAAAGTTATGTTGSESSHTHSGPDHSHTLPNTDAAGAHSHTWSATTGSVSAGQDVQSGFGVNVAANPHTHAVSGNTSSDGSHSHSFSSNTGNAGTGTTGAGSSHSHSIPALGIGSLDMAHVNVLPYFRR